MPVVTVDKVRFVVHWKSEWIEILRYIDENFKTLSGNIDWKAAEKVGLLSGFPNVSLKYISRYWSTKKRKRDRVQQSCRSDNTQRLSVLHKNGIPKRIRFLWTRQQQIVLDRLVRRHKRKSVVDWKGVWNDPQRKKLPTHYTLVSLRKYWNSTNHIDSDLNIKSSLAWRKANPERYRQHQLKIARRRKNEKNAFLYSRMEYRR